MPVGGCCWELGKEHTNTHPIPAQSRQLKELVVAIWAVGGGEGRAGLDRHAQEARSVQETLTRTWVHRWRAASAGSTGKLVKAKEWLAPRGWGGGRGWRTAVSNSGKPTVQFRRTQGWERGGV